MSQRRARAARRTQPAPPPPRISRAHVRRIFGIIVVASAVLGAWFACDAFADHRAGRNMRQAIAEYVVNREPETWWLKTHHEPQEQLEAFREFRERFLEALSVADPEVRQALPNPAIAVRLPDDQNVVGVIEGQLPFVGLVPQDQMADVSRRYESPLMAAPRGDGFFLPAVRYNRIFLAVIVNHEGTHLSRKQRGVVAPANEEEAIAHEASFRMLVNLSGGQYQDAVRRLSGRRAWGCRQLLSGLTAADLRELEKAFGETLDRQAALHMSIAHYIAVAFDYLDRRGRGAEKPEAYGWIIRATKNFQ